ncbi:glycosyltransferase family 4 protein [Caloramator sp. CAR-1]|uniref:glycosyltransferase family 4 protein n=1 Tax=Caloramator sp. CAR-1 TaxID=3062777 RepID=UPI0026E367DC|nr:glycosyltransferase family 4 protein [Caloramator sp. CAR-1]MDO6355735.1 glycosyltransferase family 4 protein [Caloramator sp. CAR-1]
MKKVLIVATVVKTHIMQFHIPHMKWLKENNYEVHVCARNDYENKSECVIPYCDCYYDIPFERNPFDIKNITAYKHLKKIIGINNYDIIHCHTPVGGVLSRLAARSARKKGTKVIYTAHGFHFYKGAPIKNWILYYPIEKWLSRYTNVLITINDEDYNCAISKGFKAKKIYKVNGVGIDLKKFGPQTQGEKKELRKHYGYKDEDFILINVAELNSNKNQVLLINAINKLKDKIPNIKLLLVGTGPLKEQYEELVKKLNLENYVVFLGYRRDVPELMALSDIAVSASKREGLPVNVMEAMATGLPLVVTDCRGNRDLVINKENGYVVGIDDVKKFADSVEELYKSEELRKKYSQRSLEFIKHYSLQKVVDEMKKIYEN